MERQRIDRSRIGPLLEQYLHRLRSDAEGLASATKQEERDAALRWAEDELRHTAATLEGLTVEEAEYELSAVLREARERLDILTNGPDLITSAA